MRSRAPLFNVQRASDSLGPTVSVKGEYHSRRRLSGRVTAAHRLEHLFGHTLIKFQLVLDPIGALALMYQDGHQMGL